MKEFIGRWKYSKKQGCMIWKCKKRKVKKAKYPTATQFQLPQEWRWP